MKYEAVPSSPAPIDRTLKNARVTKEGVVVPLDVDGDPTLRETLVEGEDNPRKEAAATDRTSELLEQFQNVLEDVRHGSTKALEETLSSGEITWEETKKLRAFLVHGAGNLKELHDALFGVKNWEMLCAFIDSVYEGSVPASELPASFNIRGKITEMLEDQQEAIDSAENLADLEYHLKNKGVLIRSKNTKSLYTPEDISKFIRKIQSAQLSGDTKAIENVVAQIPRGIFNLRGKVRELIQNK